MCSYKKISGLVFFLILLITPPCSAQTGMNPVIIKTSILKTADSIHVDYEIRNMRPDKALHPLVTTFLAGKTNHSESLGDIPHGKVARYKCDFDTAGMLPGNYILATRIDFGDQHGQVRRAYHFSSVTWNVESIKKDSDPLGTRLKSPYFNRKSFWHPRGKFELTLKNNLPQTLEPVIIFFLPDGLTVSEPEKVYPLKAGEEQKTNIPLSFDQTASPESAYWVLAWHEANGMHYSQLITGTVRIEEKPIYFKIFLILCVVIIPALAIIYFFLHRRKKTAGD
jgi:hypothetical protein